MSMTRKDYVLIAEALKKATKDEAATPAERSGAKAAARRVAAAIGTSNANANFDYGRFLAASGAL